MGIPEKSTFPKELIYKAIYYKLGFSLSYYNISEMFAIDGYKVSNSTIVPWVLKSTMELEKRFLPRKKKVSCLWIMNPIGINIEGEWVFLYRAIDEKNNTVDYLLTEDRSYKSTYDFLEKAIKNNGVPLLISVSYRSDTLQYFIQAIKVYNKTHGTNIHIAVGVFLTMAIHADNKVIIRRVRNYSVFKSFDSARKTIIGIEVLRMIEKGQIKNPCKTPYRTLVSLLKK